MGKCFQLGSTLQISGWRPTWRWRPSRWYLTKSIKTHQLYPISRWFSLENQGKPWGFSITACEICEFTGSISTTQPCTLDEHCIAGLVRSHVHLSEVAGLSTTNRWLLMLLQVCQGWLGDLGGYPWILINQCSAKSGTNPWITEKSDEVLCVQRVHCKSLIFGGCLCPGVGEPIEFSWKVAPNSRASRKLPVASSETTAPLRRNPRISSKHSKPHWSFASAELYASPHGWRIDIK